MFYGYARISTEGQHDTSIQAQIDFLSRQASSLGEDFTPIREKGSGKNTEGRPLFSALINRLKEGDVLGVYDNSRLGRNTQENLEVFSQLTLKGVRLHCNGRFIDMTSPQEKMLFSVESAFSTFQRDLQLSKSLQGIKTTKENGDWILRGDLMGYNLTKSRGKTTATLDPQGSRIVKYIFEEYSKGESVFKISKALQGTVVPSVPKYTFTPCNVRRILLKPIYMGYYTRETLDYTLIHKIGKDALKDLLVKSNIYPPIVEEELWWDVFDKWRGLRRTHARQYEYRYSYYEATSVLRCPFCGKGYVHRRCKKANSDIEYFTCNSHLPSCKRTRDRALPLPVVYRLLRSSFFFTFLDPIEAGSFFETERFKVEETLEDTALEIKAVQEDLTKVNEKIYRIVEYISDGTIPKDVAKKKIEELTEEKNSLEKSLGVLEKKNSLLSLDLEDMLLESSTEIMETFVHNPDIRRDYYKKYLKRAEVFEDRLELEYLNGKWFKFFFKKRGYDTIRLEIGYKEECPQYEGTLQKEELKLWEINPTSPFEEAVNTFQNKLVARVTELMKEC